MEENDNSENAFSEAEPDLNEGVTPLVPAHRMSQETPSESDVSSDRIQPKPTMEELVQCFDELVLVVRIGWNLPPDVAKAIVHEFFVKLHLKGEKFLEEFDGRPPIGRLIMLVRYAVMQYFKDRSKQRSRFISIEGEGWEAILGSSVDAYTLEDYIFAYRRTLEAYSFELSERDQIVEKVLFEMIPPRPMPRQVEERLIGAERERFLPTNGRVLSEAEACAFIRREITRSMNRIRAHWVRIAQHELGE